MDFCKFCPLRLLELTDNWYIFHWLILLLFYSILSISSLGITPDIAKKFLFHLIFQPYKFHDLNFGAIGWWRNTYKSSNLAYYSSWVRMSCCLEAYDAASVGTWLEQKNWCKKWNKTVYMHMLIYNIAWCMAMYIVRMRRNAWLSLKDLRYMFLYSVYNAIDDSFE